MNAIDTNVLVYAVDESEPTKQAKAIDLLETLSAQPVRLVILWQVAVEFVACLRPLGIGRPADAEGHAGVQG